MDPKAKKKAGILADAALTGVMVTKIEVLATARTEIWPAIRPQSSGIDARLAVCEAAMAPLSHGVSYRSQISFSISI